MSRINVKMLSEDSLIYLRKNVVSITKKIMENNDNNWIKNEFPQPMFIEKKFDFENFELEDNPDSKDKKIDYRNSLKIYESLKALPRHIICDEKFWLWLHFEKFYGLVKNMMKITNASTVLNAWMHDKGNRRGLMFGVLSRLYFRVELSIDEVKPERKYELTKFVIDNPLRFRDLTWRSFSSQNHLVRGILRGEMRAINDYSGKENNSFYQTIAKYISMIGSVRLLDSISEKDIEQITYNKMMELMKTEEEIK